MKRTAAVTLFVRSCSRPARGRLVIPRSQLFRSGFGSEGSTAAPSTACSARAPSPACAGSSTARACPSTESPARARSAPWAGSARSRRSAGASWRRARAGGTSRRSNSPWPRMGFRRASWTGISAPPQARRCASSSAGPACRLTASPGPRWSRRSERHRRAARSRSRLRSRGAYSDAFGPRGNRFHTGIDYRSGRGTPVVAAASGRVTFAGFSAGGWGRLVTIAHGGGTRTMYAHLSRVGVRVGQYVQSGQRIGRVGSSGNSTGPHLHFEVRVRGAAVDPMTGL